jgi:hypothetical protein
MIKVSAKIAMEMMIDKIIVWCEDVLRCGIEK